MPASSSPSEFTIRSATSADLPAIKRVLAAVRTEYGVEPDCESVDDDLLDLPAGYVQRGGCFEVLADAAGRIVGCAGLYPLDGHRAEVRKMYILQTARGRGYGRRLLENLLHTARRQGFAEIWLETNSALKEAASLYRRYGFRAADAEHLGPRCDQAYVLRLSERL